MKSTIQQHNDFLAHRALPGVKFEHNSSVDVIAGDHAGEVASIISVEELGDDPLYLVELGSGEDAHISQSSLAFMPPNTSLERMRKR
jgi:hypothetical protein